MSESDVRHGRGRRLWLFGLLLVGAGITVLISALNRDAPLDSVRPVEVLSDGYVGSSACKSCHQEEYTSWHASFHRTMTQKAAPETIQIDLDGLEIEVDGYTYRFEEGDEAIHVDMPDFESEYVNARTQKRLALVTGSHHMHVFWHETESSRLLSMLPVVYRLDEEKWIPRDSAFLRPRGQPRTERARWNATCTRCHTTHPRPRCEGQLESCDSHVAEFGISCEACHGPGVSHVQAASEATSKDESVGLIVNPADLVSRRTSQVCAQCHMRSVISDDDMREFWKKGFTYRPGDDIYESSVRHLVTCCGATDDPVVRYFLRRDPSFYRRDSFWPDGMIRVSGSEYNGLIDSPCYQRGEMSCLSCHTMHGHGHDTSKLSEWADDQLKPRMRGNETCLQCHSGFRDKLTAHTHHAADSAGSECMNCHMPHTTYGLLSAIRSHQISTPSVESMLQTGRPTACNLCHLDRTLEWTAQSLHEWYDHERPGLNEEWKSNSASIVQLLRGDAGQRALIAWAFGWQPAQEASGVDWMAPFLLVVMGDPYDAVRQISYASLRTLPGFQDYSYDFILPMRSTAPQLEDSLLEWRETARIQRPELLFDNDGKLAIKRLEALIEARDDKAMSLAE